MPDAHSKARIYLVRKHPQKHRDLYTQELVEVKVLLIKDPREAKKIRDRANTKARTRLVNLYRDEYRELVEQFVAQGYPRNRKGVHD